MRDILLRICVSLIIFQCVHICFCQNLIQTPGFESKGGWSYWGGEISTDSRSGEYALVVINDASKWSGADQTIHFSPEVKEVEVSGWMKTENIGRKIGKW